MKKLVCFVMAVMLCLSLVAFAAPSPASNDLVVPAIVDANNQVVEGAEVFKTDNQEAATALRDELVAALETAATPEAKTEAIAQVLDTSAVELVAVIDTADAEATGELTVAEIFDIGANGFENVTEDTTVTLKFDAPFKAGHTVAVVVKYMDADGNWVTAAFPGVANEDGSINVTLPAEVLQSIDANGGQISIVCDTASIG